VARSGSRTIYFLRCREAHGNNWGERHADRCAPARFELDPMLLKFSEELNVDASPEEIWKLLRDTPRLAALLPGVESVAPLNEPGVEAYQAKAVDRIGPFKVALNLEIRMIETQERSCLKASLKGGDSIGLNRITGSLQIILAPASSSAHMKFEADIEILGKLATLGAVPIRRRTTEKFAEFARNIQAQFIPGERAEVRIQPAKDGL
jgi:carbon monoxide dehydrogenase subunit G